MTNIYSKENLKKLHLDELNNNIFIQHERIQNELLEKAYLEFYSLNKIKCDYIIDCYLDFYCNFLNNYWIVKPFFVINTKEDLYWQVIKITLTSIGWNFFSSQISNLVEYAQHTIVYIQHEVNEAYVGVIELNKIDDEYMRKIGTIQYIYNDINNAILGNISPASGKVRDMDRAIYFIWKNPDPSLNNLDKFVIWKFQDVINYIDLQPQFANTPVYNNFELYKATLDLFKNTTYPPYDGELPNIYKKLPFQGKRVFVTFVNWDDLYDLINTCDFKDEPKHLDLLALPEDGYFVINWHKKTNILFIWIPNYLNIADIKTIDPNIFDFLNQKCFNNIYNQL